MTLRPLSHQYATTRAHCTERATPSSCRHKSRVRHKSEPFASILDERVALEDVVLRSEHSSIHAIRPLSTLVGPIVSTAASSPWLRMKTCTAHRCMRSTLDHCESAFAGRMQECRIWGAPSFQECTSWPGLRTLWLDRFKVGRVRNVRLLVLLLDPVVHLAAINPFAVDADARARCI